jgi:hypothetical protein
MSCQLFQAYIPSVSGSGVAQVWRPEREEDGIMPAARGGDLERLMALESKLPAWNAELRGFALDFKGRVRLASVKNFQLVCPVRNAGGWKDEGKGGWWPCVVGPPGQRRD